MVIVVPARGLMRDKDFAEFRKMLASGGDKEPFISPSVQLIHVGVAADELDVGPMRIGVGSIEPSLALKIEVRNFF
jgi:hypothetical protein